jgi:hypothetical protein
MCIPVHGICYQHPLLKEVYLASSNKFVINLTTKNGKFLYLHYPDIRFYMLFFEIWMAMKLKEKIKYQSIIFKSCESSDRSERCINHIDHTTN